MPKYRVEVCRVVEDIQSAWLEVECADESMIDDAVATAELSADVWANCKTEPHESHDLWVHQHELIA